MHAEQPHFCTASPTAGAVLGGADLQPSASINPGAVHIAGEQFDLNSDTSTVPGAVLALGNANRPGEPAHTPGSPLGANAVRNKATLSYDGGLVPRGAGALARGRWAEL